MLKYTVVYWSIYRYYSIYYSILQYIVQYSVQSVKILKYKSVLWVYWCHEFDLSGSRDVTGHVTIWYPICHFLLVVLWKESLSPAVFDILALSVLGSKVWLLRATWRVINAIWFTCFTSKQRSRSFILVPIDFSYVTSYRLSTVRPNFCSMTHCLATIHYVTVLQSQTTDDRQTRN